jgi:hypothetical protein
MATVSSKGPGERLGEYYHENVIVQTPAGTHKCAIDVDSKSVPNGVEWRVVGLEGCGRATR